MNRVTRSLVTGLSSLVGFLQIALWRDDLPSTGGHGFVYVSSDFFPLFLQSVQQFAKVPGIEVASSVFIAILASVDIWKSGLPKSVGAMSCCLGGNTLQKLTKEISGWSDSVISLAKSFLV
jgi:hypothetical protein